jgi:hypothetical protein
MAEDRLDRLYELRERLEAEITRLEALRAAKPRRRRSKFDPPPPCGTERKFQWHHYRGHDLEGDPCGCVAAHRENNRNAERRRRREVAAA